MAKPEKSGVVVFPPRHTAATDTQQRRSRQVADKFQELLLLRPTCAKVVEGWIDLFLSKKPPAA